MHDVGEGLDDAGGDDAHPGLGGELHGDLRGGVHLLQIEDELGQVLDRVDVVVRRRRDEGDARLGMAQARDLLARLVARELTALAGLRPLGDLDLELVGMRGIRRRDPEAGRCDLLDPRVALGSEAGRVLAPLARVRAGAEPVQRDRKQLVRFLAQRSVRHRAARETLDDRLDRLDLVERHRLPVGDELQEIARLERLPVMDEGCEAVVLGAVAAGNSPAQSLRSHGLVERGHDLRARRVRLASLSMLEEARVLERRPVRRGRNLPLANVPLQLGETDAAEWARGSPEAAVDNLLREPDRVEELGAAVARHVRDPHLRHHLHDAVLDRGAKPALRLVGRRMVAADLVCGSHGGNGLEREPRADRLGPVPEQAGEVMYLARLVARDHDRGERAEADFDETVVDGPGSEKRRHRRTLGARASVRDEQNVGTGPDGRLGLGGQTPAGRLERLQGAEGGVDRRRLEAV